MNRVAFHTLGCKLNVAEMATLGRTFKQRGYSIVDIDEAADVCVINTCSVTERADRECRQIVRRALRRSPHAYVIVVGCYAQLQPEAIAAIEGVDLVLGSKEKFDLFSFGANFHKTGEARIAVSPIEQVNNFGTASSVGFSDRTRAFLKVQDGCDYTCAFCTIPLARGSSRSVSVEETVDQAKAIAAEGYREIVLTGVNVGDYGRKTGSNLLALLKELVKIDTLDRIRISSIEPNLLHDDLLRLWLDTEKICNHFHLPLQGGSDELLRAMRRRYPTGWYSDRVEAIKAADQHACIGADVIVGFPGETDELFEKTYRYLVELPISYLHVFTYSKRPNTIAADLPDHVEPRIRFERSERMRILGAKKRHAFALSFVNETKNVLFEREKTRGVMTGLTAEYVRVNVRSEVSLVNRILSVRMTDVEDEGCVGVLAPMPNQTSLDLSERATVVCA